MNKKFLEITKIVFSIISIILIIISIVLILIKLFGHSPTETMILFSIVGILVSLQVVVITILFQMKEDIGSIKEFKRQTITEVMSVKERFDFFNNRLSDMENRLSKKR